MNRIRKGDQVIVTTGKDKGKKGEVVRVLGDKVVVSNVNVVKRHTKQNPQAGQPGGVVERESPDAVVCTHFLPVEALSHIRGRGRLRVPLHCVITDFGAHPFWAFPHVDRYFVATDETARELAALGVPRARIEVTGIPVDPSFANPIGREAARARVGLDAREPAVLIMGGGSGVGPMTSLAERLAALALRPRVIVVCGTNEGLRAALPQRRVALVHEGAEVVEHQRAGERRCGARLDRHDASVVIASSFEAYEHLSGFRVLEPHLLAVVMQMPCRCQQISAHGHRELPRLRRPPREDVPHVAVTDAVVRVEVHGEHLGNVVAFRARRVVHRHAHVHAVKILTRVVVQRGVQRESLSRSHRHTDRLR